MLNHIYDHFNKAFATLDPQEMLFIYTQDASYISDNQSKEILLGRNDIIAQYRAFFKKINDKQANIEVDFRILQRHIEGSSATDIGYYLIRYYPHVDDGEPMSEFAGKFVGVSKKSPNGHWYLVVETNNKANTAFYYDAKPQPNLYYGRQFPPISSGLINTND
ncbi:YybH family protein [Shewanella surugensis]|uniref:Nuclear transport factor 2 family protein n=1 Tax=Shewanella surugensis TaxID=212020 RepID=A0ABT0L9E0_9GAMM|nr:nuclear transport factor 2 family protein [Shewanella surugensis]MCL1124250.1 nuclear transport factor 2 family protein [Shewanella surugensis]